MSLLLLVAVLLGQALLLNGNPTFINKKKSNSIINLIFSIEDVYFYKEKIRDYLKTDLLLLKNIITFLISVLSTFNLDVLKCITISSISFLLFKTHFYLKENIVQINTNSIISSFILKSYFGGLSEKYHNCIVNGHHYDINSFYPFIMKNYNIPAGKGS